MRKSNFIGTIVSVSALVMVFLMLGMFGSAVFPKSSSGNTYDMPAGPVSPKSSSGNRYNIPNVPLVTHEGKTVMFYDDLIKDKKVLINFMYSKCEESCPLATAKLAQIQRRLGDRIGRSIFIYSISLDPVNDTPEVLKKYAEKYGAGPGWYFLTGTQENIDAVSFRLGERLDKESHNNVIRLGTGRSWMKLTMFGDIDYLVNEIGKTLDQDWYLRTGATVKSFSDAPKIKTKTLGNLMFLNRCSPCHTVGKGDRIGPDLRGVTSRRDLQWLARYIHNPELMRARKDPIALELSARFDGMVMPNLQLATYEVTDLIHYLDDESSRLEKLDQGKHEGHHEKHQAGKHEEHHHAHES